MPHGTPIVDLLGDEAVLVQIGGIQWTVQSEDFVWNDVGVLIVDAVNPNPDITWGAPTFYPWHAVSFLQAAV